MTYDSVAGLQVELAGAVLRLTLDRPAQRNAIDDTVMEGLIVAIDAAGRDESVRAILIGANGERNNLEVVRGGRVVDPWSVDWSRPGNVQFRQRPGPRNALGGVKFLFPNEFDVYLHDTPADALFARVERDYSHGCVRLADPRGMAAAVLGQSVDYVADKLKKGHSSEKVSRKIPVYVAYFTAWPDMSGKVEYFDDVYGRDDRLKNAIAKTDEVRVPPTTDPVLVSTTEPAAVAPSAIKPAGAEPAAVAQ